MLNFAMFLANSNQEKIRTIRFDPYCPHEVFITFHQRLMVFSISNAFRKLNRRQQNLTHIVLNITIVFNLRCIFQCFRQILIKGEYGLTCFKCSIKNYFLFVSNIHKIEIKDKINCFKTVCPILPF